MKTKVNKSVNHFKLFISFFAILIGIAGCNQTIDYTDYGTQVMSLLPEMVMEGNTIDLVKTIEGHSVTWKVDKNEYVDEFGKVINAEDYDVTLKLTIYIDGVKSGEKSIILSRDLDDYFSLVESYVRAFIRERSRGDIRLKNDYYNEPGLTISYESSRPTVVGNDGTYYEHEYDEDVVFDVSVSYRDHLHEFVVNHNSIGRPDNEKINIIDNWLTSELSTMTFTEGIELPSSHPLYGGRIRWICEEPYVVLNNKDFFLPLNAGKYMLMAEVNFPGSIEQFTYYVNLPATQITDPLIRAARFLEVATADEMSEFLVLYDGATPEIIRHVIGDDDREVKNQVHGGIKPIVSQTILDERMYEGYIMTNEDNVLWIVVHETGMKTVGLFAERFDATQQSRAYDAENPDSVSWHYTIDDNKIIQNYEDNIAAWHAGDGSKIGGGNKNGIGIEMCINADGKYDASLRHDARLVASLLIKYNLNMANVKRHRDFMLKDCPETMIKERRWFEFLDLVAKEYISQTLLSTYDITYDVTSSNTLVAWSIDGMYQNTSLISGETVSFTTTIAEQEIALAVKIK